MATIGLAAIIAIEAFAIATHVHYLGIGDDILGGNTPSAADITDATDRSSLAGKLLFVGYLGIGSLTFIPWFRVAYGNVFRPNDPTIRYTPAWSIGAWFVPILNLIRPKQIADDLYRASARGHSPARADSPAPIPAYMNWWWGLFLLAGVVGRIGAYMVRAANDTVQFDQQSAFDALRDEQSGVKVEIAGFLMAIAALCLAIYLVRDISRRQSESGDSPGTERASALG